MADIEKLKGIMDTYGIGVRAGVITPCFQDEKLFRDLLGVLPAPKQVVDLWAAQGGIRAPVTLQQPKALEESESPEETTPETTTEGNEE